MTKPKIPIKVRILKIELLFFGIFKKTNNKLGQCKNNISKDKQTILQTSSMKIQQHPKDYTQIKNHQ
ncbi:hypothetical protein PSI15_05520 [Xenorhabdus sp. PR6a]|nr:hypothetical protein [Xenorhabdus sp. PR6a]MDC9581036.1 hypothetical protein [Xenorhabdus sp. PR6a]